MYPISKSGKLGSHSSCCCVIMQKQIEIDKKKKVMHFINYSKIFPGILIHLLQRKNSFINFQSLWWIILFRYPSDYILVCYFSFGTWVNMVLHSFLYFVTFKQYLPFLSLWYMFLYPFDQIYQAGYWLSWYSNLNMWSMETIKTLP